MIDAVSLKGKRIILVFGSLDMGGAERQGLHLANALQQRYGADVLVLGLKDQPGRLSQLCEEAGIPWCGFSFNWGKTALTRVPNLVRLAGELRSLRPDIILSYTAIPNLACGIVWKYTGAALLVWNQRDEGLLLNRKFWHRHAVRSTRFFIANSGNGRKFLMDAYAADPCRIVVVHNGVEPCLPLNSREEWRSRLGISPDRSVGCMVANFHPFKDHETLLRAWAGVVSRAGDGTAPVLLLAGRNDLGEESLRQLVEELKIAEYVRFIGKVDDVAGLLQATDLCLHSSKSEGLPNAVLEAMAAGCPLVATDIPGVREALGDAMSEYMVPMADSAAFAERICRLLADSGLRRRVGEQLRERVAGHFNLDGMSATTAAFISEWVRDANSTKP